MKLERRIGKVVPAWVKKRPQDVIDLFCVRLASPSFKFREIGRSPLIHRLLFF